MVLRSTNTTKTPLNIPCECGRSVPIPEMITKGYEQTIALQQKYIEGLETDLKISGGDAEEIEKEPLTEKARIIYEKLATLQEHEAMTRPNILDWLAREKEIYLDEGTFNKIRKELLPYGIKNKPRIGYYIRK